MTDASQSAGCTAAPPTRKSQRRPAERAAAETLKKAREAAGLSLEALGARVGRGSAHLSNIETGRGAPSVDLLERIAAELKLDPAPLLCAYRVVPERAADAFFNVDRMRAALGGRGVETLGCSNADCVDGMVEIAASLVPQCSTKYGIRISGASCGDSHAPPIEEAFVFERAGRQVVVTAPTARAAWKAITGPKPAVMLGRGGTAWAAHEDGRLHRAYELDDGELAFSMSQAAKGDVL